MIGLISTLNFHIFKEYIIFMEDLIDMILDKADEEIEK